MRRIPWRCNASNDSYAGHGYCQRDQKRHVATARISRGATMAGRSRLTLERERLLIFSWPRVSLPRSVIRRDSLTIIYLALRAKLSWSRPEVLPREERLISAELFCCVPDTSPECKSDSYRHGKDHRSGNDWLPAPKPPLGHAQPISHLQLPLR